MTGTGTLRFSVFSGAACCLLSLAGLREFLKADYFHDPGPYAQNSWHGYNGAHFAGLALFTFCPTIGFTLLYVGLRSLAQAKPGLPTLLPLAAFGAACMTLGGLGMVWGAETMQCLGAFCVGTRRYVEVPHARPEAGLGFLSLIGLAAFFSLLPAGAIAVLSALKLMREGATQHLPPAPLRPLHPGQEVRQRSQVALSLLAALLAFFVTTLYVPNTWENFVAARIAKNAALLASDNASACATDWGTYTCPEVGWASLTTRNLRISEGLALKLYPSNLIFFLYLFALPLLVVLVRTGRRGRLFLKRAVAVPLAGVYSAGELLASGATAVMLAAFFYYWAHDHNFNGSWTGGGDPGIAPSERWARAFGQLAVAFMSLLLFPASRGSALHGLLGSSWEASLWAHRWLGRGMLCAVLAHVAAWYKKYGEVGLFPRDVFDVPMSLPQSVDNFTVPLITLTTWVLFICMGALALQPVRRRYFELFYYTHLYAACVAIPAVLWHAAAAWEYLLPGLTVWFVDRLIRMSRSGDMVEVLSTSTFGGVTEISFRKPGMVVRPGQYVFLNVPELSSFEWHPFTLSSGCASAHCSLHIKSMGAGTWTGRLSELVSVRCAQGCPQHVTLAVDGPHGTPVDLADYSRVVLVAGGIGVTPCLSLLSSLRGRGSRVDLIWALRDTGLLSGFAAPLSRSGDTSAAHVGLLAGCPREFDWPRGFIKVFVTCQHSGKEEELQTLERSVRGLAIMGGRPAFPQECAAVASETPPDEVLVFACGPGALVADARAAALGQGFHFHSETFLL